MSCSLTPDPPSPPGLHLVHVDSHALVVDKPAGLLSVPGRGPDKQDCVATRVQALFPQARVVHRLDMATSGLLLMACSLEDQRAFSAAFEQGRVCKRYVAVVQGHLPSPASDDDLITWDGEADWRLIDLPLGADWPRRPLQKVDPAHGRASRTLWRILGHEGGCTRVDLAPLTGRSHQLRVHLQALGHPILGDALYAPPETAQRSTRLLLHAQRLSLPHPDGPPEAHGRIAWSSPAPF